MANIGNSEMREFRDLREMLECSTMRFGTCVAFHEKKQGFYQHISYGRLFEEIEALGTALIGRLPKAPRVLLIGKNSYVYALTYVSLLCGAGVPVPASSGLDGGALSTLAKRLGINAVICESAMRETVAELSLPILTFDEVPSLIDAGKAALEAGEYTVFEVPVNPSAVATVFPGSNGGEDMLLSHERMLATVMALDGERTVGPKDIFLSVLPLCTVHEMLAGILYPLLVGASVAFAEGAHGIMRNMREIHPTCMVANSWFAKRLYDKFWSLAEGSEREIRRVIAATDPVRPLVARQALKTRLLGAARAPFGGALRYLVLVGSPLEAPIAKGLRQIGIFAAATYGIRECGVLAAMATPAAYCDGTAGKTISERLEILEKQPDGSGEILIKTGGIDEGYLTGERGRIDAQGFLHVIGKTENRIVQADGTAVSPEEAERLLRQSPLVKEAAVVGVPTEGGLEIAAMIVPDTDSLEEILGPEYTGEDLERAMGEWLGDVNEGLSDAARIALFALCDTALPRDAAGQLLRDNIVTMLCSATAADSETVGGEE